MAREPFKSHGKTPKPAIKRGWYTWALLTAEGQLYGRGRHPAHVVRSPEPVLVDELITLAKTRMDLMPEGGAYAIWEGSLDQHELVHSPQPPICYIHQGGRIEWLGPKAA